jgi:hypothetical protein
VSENVQMRVRPTYRVIRDFIFFPDFGGYLPASYQKESRKASVTASFRRASTGVFGSLPKAPQSNFRRVTAPEVCIW